MADKLRIDPGGMVLTLTVWFWTLLFIGFSGTSFFERQEALIFTIAAFPDHGHLLE